MRSEDAGVRWLVDGMNLIGSRPNRWWNDPDGAGQPPDVPAGAHGAVQVAFASRRGRNAADHEIVQLLETDPDPGSFRVVTSDRDLIERVRHLGAGTTSASSFRRQLDQALGDSAGG